MSNLVRVFRGIAKPGQEDAFRSFLLDDAVPILDEFEGFVGVEVGLPAESSPREFLMITRWKSIEALKNFAGEAWQDVVIHPREIPLVEVAFVHHYWECVPSS